LSVLINLIFSFRRCRYQEKQLVRIKINNNYTINTITLSKVKDNSYAYFYVVYCVLLRIFFIDQKRHNQCSCK